MNGTPKPPFGRPRRGVEPSPVKKANQPDGWRESAFTGQIALEYERQREAGRMRLAVLTGIVLGVAGVGLSHLDMLVSLANYIAGGTAS